MAVQNISGIELSYREFGTATKRTIVFAHPVLFDSSVFDSLVSVLENDFHLVLLDIHGHGRSGYRSPLTLEDMAADHYELLVKLDLSRVTWIGYSIGGLLGMRLALRHPEALESLILMATSARLDPPEMREQIWSLWQMFRYGHREHIVDAALQLFFAPATFARQPELVAKYREQIINYNRVQAEGMFEVTRAVLHRTDISEEIGGIRVPTLAIAGNKDLSPLPDELKLIVSRIPNARLALIDDASHLLAVEKPQQVSQVVKKFLQARTLSWRALGGHGEYRRTAFNPWVGRLVGQLENHGSVRHSTSL